MLKLYKQQEGELLYWEAWEDAKEIVLHWGVLGDRGETAVVPLPEFEPPMTAIEKQAYDVRQDGFSERKADDLFELIIRYEHGGNDASADIERAYAIEELMDETLGWTGNGYCEGNDITDGGVNIYCFVVEPRTACKTIVDDLTEADLLDGAVIAYQDRDRQRVVLWPLDYTGQFKWP